MMLAWVGADCVWPRAMDFHAVTGDLERLPSAAAVGDVQGLQEMLGSTHRPQRWQQPPALTVLVPVMTYRPGGDVEYAATNETLTAREIDELVHDLTKGLSLLTANTFERFSSVSRVVVPPGATARVSRPDHIVVGRFHGLRRSVNTLGFGGRRARRDGTITSGAILLDSEFDATSASRRLLRTHELGHALGYNHVHARASVMNPALGSEPNEFDRQAARIAFRLVPIVASR